MESPTIEPVVVHSRRSKRIVAPERRNIRPGLDSPVSESPAGDRQNQLSAIEDEGQKGSHDVQAELVPVEKKDHLGLLSTM